MMWQKVYCVVVSIILVPWSFWVWQNAWDVHYFDPHGFCTDGKVRWESRTERDWRHIALFGCYASDRPTAKPKGVE